MSLESLLDNLKEINKVVDATKGTLQIQILTSLNSDGPQDVEELSRSLGKRRKALTDAIRKLKLKNLVAEEMSVGRRGEEVRYSLTEKGKEYIDYLLNIFKPKPLVSFAEGNRLVGLVEQLPLLFYTYDAIIALGMANERGLPIRKLAGLFSLSEERAMTYLDLFVDAPGARLFRKRIGLKNGEISYALTDEGKSAFRLLPIYSRMKTSVTFRILAMLTHTIHPKQIYLRLTLIMALGSVISIVALNLPMLYIFAMAWLFFAILIGGIVALDWYLVKR